MDDPKGRTLIENMGVGSEGGSSIPRRIIHFGGDCGVKQAVGDDGKKPGGGVRVEPTSRNVGKSNINDS